MSRPRPAPESTITARAGAMHPPKLGWSWRLSQSQGVRVVAVAALIAAAGLGLPVLRDEWVAAHLEAATTQDLGGPAPLPWEAGGLPAARRRRSGRAPGPDRSGRA